MARVSCKHLVFVFLVFLCFISITNGARSLRAAPPSVVAERGQDDVLIAPAEDNGVKKNDGADDLVTVDYTPAGRKPPIHN